MHFEKRVEKTYSNIILHSSLLNLLNVVEIFIYVFDFDNCTHGWLLLKSSHIKVFTEAHCHKLIASYKPERAFEDYGLAEKLRYI